MQQPTKWGFYGQQKELKNFHKIFPYHHSYTAVAVLGGRGYRKTELINRAGKTFQKDGYWMIQIEVDSPSEKGHYK